MAKTAQKQGRCGMSKDQGTKTIRAVNKDW